MISTTFGRELMQNTVILMNRLPAIAINSIIERSKVFFDFLYQYQSPAKEIRDTEYGSSTRLKANIVFTMRNASRNVFGDQCCGVAMFGVLEAKHVSRVMF